MFRDEAYTGTTTALVTSNSQITTVQLLFCYAPYTDNMQVNTPLHRCTTLQLTRTMDQRSTPPELNVVLKTTDLICGGN